jgi:UDP-N-acetylmuramoyl-L-alanyl-D-glutamate--2,6-diaminopimelate ligase
VELKEILYKVRLEEVFGTTQRDILGIHFDSRKIQPGFLFVAIPGLTLDGHSFIETSIKNGAIAIILEYIPDSLNIKDYPEVSFLRVQNSQEALGALAGNFFEHPSQTIKLVGVTGTNGKTTCATLLFQLFTELGYTCGLISTVQNQIGLDIVPTRYTTPDALSIQELLHEMLEKGCDYCFMEVSSHAIVQGRISGLYFRGGIFTNITHDHLDFHKTFANYIAAKKTFFDRLSSEAFALTNQDDRNGMVMVQNTPARIKTYGLKNLADYKGKVLENHFSGMLLRIQEQEVWFKMVGNFNAYNLLAVYGASMELGEDSTQVLTLLSRLSGAEGRFNYIPGPNAIKGIVDYAHTPDALENILKTIQDLRKDNEKIITIIGCGGDRDKTKRPEMAEIACKLSDKVILTSDNPRTESPESILKDMEAGIPPEARKKTLIIQERRSAIQTACHLAGKGDIIVLAGKGHEKYQEIMGVRHPFDDKKELEMAFNNLSN